MIEQAEVAMLDDIGAEQQWPSITEALFRVLDARLGRWTVITSNLLLAHIANRLDARIASRLIRSGSEVVEVDVLDFNLRKDRLIS